MRTTTWLAGTLGLALAAGGCGFDTGGAGGGGPSDGAGAIDGGGDVDASAGAADAARADAAVEVMPNVVCKTAAAPPAIDGVKAGVWDELATKWYTFDVDDAELKADVHSSYEFDAVVVFACAHDANNLYFWLDVTDADIQNDSTSLREDDGVVVFLDGAGDRSGTYGPDDHALMLGAEDDAADYNGGAGDLTGDFSLVLTDAGYSFEVEIDKPTIADDLPAEIGFNLAIIDDDGWSNNERDIFALRHVPTPPACADCCEGQAAPWCDTSVSGTLSFE